MKPIPLTVKTIDYLNHINFDAVLFARLRRFHQVQLIRINHKKQLK